MVDKISRAVYSLFNSAIRISVCVYTTNIICFFDVHMSSTSTTAYLQNVTLILSYVGTSVLTTSFFVLCNSPLFSSVS